METGYHIRTIQELLGHKDVRTTILVDQPFLATARNIALGPVNAWILAIHDGKVFSALPLLVPATLFPLASLGWWIVRRRLVWLAVAVVAWVAAGYWFAVAIWV